MPNTVILKRENKSTFTQVAHVDHKNKNTEEKQNYLLQHKSFRLSVSRLFYVCIAITFQYFKKTSEYTFITFLHLIEYKKICGSKLIFYNFIFNWCRVACF